MMNRTNKELSNMRDAPKWGLVQTIEAMLVLLLIGYLAYGLFYTPAIFMDDWTSVIERIITDNAQWLDMSQRRPLLFSTFLLQNQLLGLNITAYYILLWFLYILMAVLLYAIIARLPLPYSNLFGLVVAALFLVFPTNYTHMWLIMFGVYCATTLTLLYGYLLLRFAQGGSWITFAFALIFLLLPLGIYEGQIGVAAAWTLILFVLYFRQNTTAKKISLLIPVALMGAYALWRTFGYQATGVADQYLSQVSTSPLVLLSRLLLGYKITLGWGWTSTMAELIPGTSSAKISFLILIAIIIILWFVCWLVFKFRFKKQNVPKNTWTLNERWSNIYPYLIAAICGVLLLGAGYVPTITVFLPGLSGIGSRFNIFATIGGSVSIAAILMIFSILISNISNQIKYYFFISAIPFIIIGIFSNASVQYHNKIAWQEQQIIWKELFVTAPDIKDDTFILFILPGYENRTGFINWKRTPLSASWEASSGIRLLYDNTTLRADVFFPDIDEPIESTFTSEGVLTQETSILTPYSKIVAFEYDNSSNSLLRLEDIPPQYFQNIENQIQLCSDCILEEGDLNVPLRESLLD